MCRSLFAQGNYMETEIEIRRGSDTGATPMWSVSGYGAPI